MQSALEYLFLLGFVTSQMKETNKILEKQASFADMYILKRKQIQNMLKHPTLSCKSIKACINENSREPLRTGRLISIQCVAYLTPSAFSGLDSGDSSGTLLWLAIGQPEALKPQLSNN